MTHIPPRPAPRTMLRAGAALTATLVLGCTSTIDDGAASSTASDAATSAQPASSNAAAPNGVVLIGDSLAEEAAPALQLVLGDVPLATQVFGGTAPCDWLDKDLGVAAGNVAVISFTGNSETPCMAGGAAGHLGGQELVDKYRNDIEELIASLTSADATVLLVGQPNHASAAENVVVDALNDVYAGMVSSGTVSFVDAGAAVENPDGSFAVELPCLDGEPECGPEGRNPVRSDDGLHFCAGTPRDGQCVDYSSGAFRFAAAIGGAILNQ